MAGKAPFGKGDRVILNPKGRAGKRSVFFSLNEPPYHGDNGRDSRGRYTKGNKGGPGNPFARRIAALRRAFCEVVTDDDLLELSRRLLDKAKAGNLVAAKLLLAYTVGRPTDAVDPDTLDLHEWLLYQKGPARPEEVAGILDRMPVALICDLMRHLMPFLGDALRQEVLDQLTAPPRKGQEETARAPGRTQE